MLKKIILGIAVLGLIAVLVIGAVNRTLARSVGVTYTGAGQQSTRQGDGRGNGSGEGSLRRGQGGGRGRSYDTATGSGLASTQEWVTMEVTVVSVDSSALTLSTDDGQTVIVTGRAWSLAQEQNFTPQVGERLEMKGFTDQNGLLEAAELRNLESGATLILRDANGRPMWAGRGSSF